MRPHRSALLLLAGGALLACTVTDASKSKSRLPTELDDGLYGDDELLEQPIQPTFVNEDSGAFGQAPERPAANKDGGVVDAGDAGVVTKTYCAGDLAAGDLVVTEIMIAARSGSSDDGEWVEIKNARDCWLVLQGVTVESPRGAAAPNAVTIAEAFELGPGATFVVADSSDPAKNHDLPGKVFAWDSADVLKNDGDAIVVKKGAVTLDSLTYPSFSNLAPGRAIAFPDDCASTARGDWARWSLTFHEWKAGYRGTPNATNDDVACF